MKRNPENDPKLEREEALKKEGWTDTGPTRVLKVVPPGKPLTEARGFVLVGLSILGRTPLEIAKAVGLPVKKYQNGAWIYKLKRKPSDGEVVYELTTKYPDGWAYDETFSDPEYPPGDESLHQWRIIDGCSVPVLADYLDLKPGQKLTYEWLCA